MLGEKPRKAIPLPPCGKRVAFGVAPPEGAIVFMLSSHWSRLIRILRSYFAE
jgi:hypothetical protein